MSSWRRFVLALLLACLPFQTVVGATGIVCAMKHEHAGARVAAVADCHGDVTAHATTHASDDTAGSDTCRFCMECCASAAPVRVAAQVAPGPVPVLRLASAASPLHASPAGDPLFRPPRA